MDLLSIIRCNSCYIISLSLQLSGALCIILANLGLSRSSIIKSFRKNAFIFVDGNTRDVSDVSEAIKDRFKQAYINGLSFVQIALGYLVGIYAKKTDNDNCLLLIAVIILTLTLLLMAYGIIGLLMKQDKVSKNITKKELDEYGIKPDMESISNEEIEAHCR